MNNKGTMNRKIMLLIFGGIIAIFSPPLSVYVVTGLGGVAAVAAFNSTMLMILSVLATMLLIINTVSLFIEGNIRWFLFSMLLAVVGLVSFLYYLTAYIGL